jgi:chromosome segregation ATPase
MTGQRSVKVQERIKAAIAALQEALSGIETLDKVSDATAKLEAVNAALAAAEEKLRDKSKLVSEAQRQAQAAHDAEIARKQQEIRALTGQIASLKKEWGETIERQEVTAALAARRAEHDAVLQSLDSIRKQLSAWTAPGPAS